MGFMLLSLIPLAIHARMKNYNLSDFKLGKGDPKSLKKVFYYLPLGLILITMIIPSLRFKDPLYSLVTFFFTISVGLAEELYFRGLILGILEKAFKPLSAVFLSVIFFSLGHITAAFMTPDPLLVSLHVLNSFLFGWLAAEIALLTQSIGVLIFFHGLFNFLDYHTAAEGSALVLVYGVRGAMLLLFAIYLLVILKKQATYSTVQYKHEKLLTGK